MKRISIKQIILSILLVIVLESVSFGEFVDRLSPFWTLILWFYFVSRFEINFVYFLALVFGLLLDVISGNLLGQNALALIITTLLIVNAKKQIRMANTATIFVFMVFISFIYIIVLNIINFIIQGFYIDYFDLFIPLNTAIFYTIIATIMQQINAKKY